MKTNKRKKDVRRRVKVTTLKNVSFKEAMRKILQDYIENGFMGDPCCFDHEDVIFMTEDQDATITPNGVGLIAKTIQDTTSIDNDVVDKIEYQFKCGNSITINGTTITYYLGYQLWDYADQYLADYFNDDELTQFKKSA